MYGNMFEELHPLTLDWSHGGAVVVDGLIYCSPNCQRPVLVPPSDTSGRDPFPKHQKLSISQFKQPVWWNHLWGWLSFIPLTPSFIAWPFEPLCWMPRIKECYVKVGCKGQQQSTERRYTMRDDDATVWMECERRLLRCADVICFRYKIHGTRPPPPSSFGFDKKHKSLLVAEKTIHVARDWFVVWMGFLSYLIAQSRSNAYNWPDRGRPDSKITVWYEVLMHEDFTERWLNGLVASSVGDFSLRTPRAGIVIDWMRTDKTRPPIQWFLDLNIPLWFPWTVHHEEYIRTTGKWDFIRPPQHILQDAITPIFHNPNLLLAALVMQRFLRMNFETKDLDKNLVQILRLKYATSFVVDLVTSWYINQVDDLPTLGSAEARTSLVPEVQKAVSCQKDAQVRAAGDAASIPFQGMIDQDLEGKGQLVYHWLQFFEARDERQTALTEGQTADERQANESTETSWNNTHCTNAVTMRSRMNGISSRALGGEDDAEEEYAGYMHSDSEDEDFQFSDAPWEEDVPLQEPAFSPASPDSTPMLDDESVPVPATPEVAPIVEHSWQFTDDIFKRMTLMYGFWPPVGPPVAAPPLQAWDQVKGILGFMPETQLPWSDNEKRSVAGFIQQLLQGSTRLPAALDDLDDTSLSALATAFNFSTIQRPLQNLYILDTPRSLSCSWSLGLESAASLLYVCRLIAANNLHMTLTVAHHLVKNNLPFRTLLLCQSPNPQRLDKPFAPRSYRCEDHIFDSKDFESAMMEARERLVRPLGRAAFLRGGILGRIAQELGSMEAVLEGPSLEVTEHKSGHFFASAHPESFYWDDELSEDDTACLCGTYRMYTGRGEQTKVVSWFPYPEDWKGSGYDWMEWTERDEWWFKRHLTLIRNPGQETPRTPMTRQEWRAAIRGIGKSRRVVLMNNERAVSYVDAKVPVS
ncbi:hypothetical protein NLJ89_g6134 [Agrocybe chaxingu]|uniref:Uncharacterized protein n=1 Tax=Agrocybe chaxingu TaxID=84603 RepID=A0A9W8JX16_9AGAR|nr:hypothetical protein NLJ89_g6134 [Agrocybe chaxingu]